MTSDKGRLVSLHGTYFGSAGIGQLLRAQGESIELTPKEGNAASMTALVGTEQSRIVRDERGKRTVRMRTFTITKDPAGEFGGAEDPQENAVVTYDGADYAVSSRQDAGEYWELVCEFAARSERSRSAFRTRD